MNETIDFPSLIAKYLAKIPCRKRCHLNSMDYYSSKHQSYVCQICSVYSNHISFSYACKTCKHQYCCLHYIEHVSLFSILATVHEAIKCTSIHIQINSDYFQRISLQNSKALGRHIHGISKPIRFSSDDRINSYYDAVMGIISTARIKSICILITLPLNLILICCSKRG